jgi:hypothetical protein
MFRIYFTCSLVYVIDVLPNIVQVKDLQVTKGLLLRSHYRFCRFVLLLVLVLLPLLLQLLPFQVPDLQVDRRFTS